MASPGSAQNNANFHIDFNINLASPRSAEKIDNFKIDFNIKLAFIKKSVESMASKNMKLN